MASLDETRADLEQRLAKLTARQAKIQGHLQQPGNPDWQERATETENDEVYERLEESELKEIEEIRTALRRIEAGTYADCARCAEPIGEARLAALPYTSRCIACTD